MQSGNPVLRSGVFGPAQPAEQTMTVEGAVTKSLILLGVLLAGAALVWAPAKANPESPIINLALYGGLGGGFVLAIVTSFFPKVAPFTSPFYALFEGVLLGAVSAFMDLVYPGIAIQALGLTAGTCFTMLALYRTGVIRATPALQRGVFAATAAIALVYLVSFVMRLFGMEMPYLHDAGPIGIAISAVIVGVAALNLILDFNLIERGAADGAPKYMEWYAAFALMVTLVWLYLEILRLLSKLRSR